LGKSLIGKRVPGKRRQSKFCTSVLDSLGLGVGIRFLLDSGSPYPPAYNTLIEEAVVQAQDIVYESIPARVVRAEHLMAIMLQTGRDKDRQRLSAFSRQAGWHQEILDDILKRHNLGSRWKEWTE